MIRATILDAIGIAGALAGLYALLVFSSAFDGGSTFYQAVTP